MSRTRWLGPPALVALLLAAAFVLDGAGGGPLATPSLTAASEWPQWLSRVGPVTGAVAVVRLLALAAVWYAVVVTLVGTVLRAAARVRPSWWLGRVIAAADRITVGPIRRGLAATAGLALATASPLPAAFAGPPSTSGPATSSPASPTPTLVMTLIEPTTEVPASPEHLAPGPNAGPAPSTPDHTVVRGECFWSIADDALTQEWGRSPTDAEIVPYWRKLIERNRYLLVDRSNPDLIYPGQVFELPPTPPRPQG